MFNKALYSFIFCQSELRNNDQSHPGSIKPIFVAMKSQHVEQINNFGKKSSSCFYVF